jgi:hypothetical protein
LHKSFENPAALSVVAKLIEARAGRREQNHISGTGLGRGVVNGRLNVVDHDGLGQ